MRVVGGKTGADGRLFAYLVWTVPGGPAEKMGLQQGDKVSILILIPYTHTHTRTHICFVVENLIELNLIQFKLCE